MEEPQVPAGVESESAAQLLEEKRCRRRAKNKAKKEESRRVRDEETRRSLYEPKNRRGVRLVGAGEAEILRGGLGPLAPGPPPAPPVNTQDFPHLGSSARPHRRSHVTIDLAACVVTEPERQAKPRRAHPITIDLMSAVKKPPEPPAPKRRSPTRLLGGNQLDSSNPERRKGKTRENPRPQKPSHLKAVILADRKARQEEGPPVGPTGARPHSIHSRKFRDYCDHVQSPELDAAVTALITDIVKFQDRLYFSDPVRAHAKRRFVLGFREAGKYLAMRKVKLLIVAPDLETAKSEGGIEDTVTRLRDEARVQGVPCAFCLGRAILRRLTNKSCVVKGISCVAVMSYEGSQDNYHAIREMLPRLAERYRELVETSVPDGNQQTPSPDLVEPPAPDVNQNPPDPDVNQQLAPPVNQQPPARDLVELSASDVNQQPPTPDVNQQVVSTFLSKLAKELE